MSRPLLITDCDEVLLHMVGPFGEWLEGTHGVRFALDRPGFADALSRDGVTLPQAEVWPLLDGFFATEMARQTPVPGALEALAAIGGQADIVVLTNIGWHCHAGRVAQLAGHGVHHQVVCNQGGKGPPVADLVAKFRPTATVFVDDIPVHHASVAEHASQVHRLHMVAEPRLAPHVPTAPEAHARIDRWADALPWILERLS